MRTLFFTIALVFVSNVSFAEIDYHRWNRDLLLAKKSFAKDARVLIEVCTNRHKAGKARVGDCMRDGLEWLEKGYDGFGKKKNRKLTVFEKEIRVLKRACADGVYSTWGSCQLVGLESVIEKLAHRLDWKKTVLKMCFYKEADEGRFSEHCVLNAVQELDDMKKYRDLYDCAKKSDRETRNSCLKEIAKDSKVKLKHRRIKSNHNGLYWY